MEKINVAEILKNCPIGMELDCTICNNVVTLKGVDKEGHFPINVVTKSGFRHILTCEGYVYDEGDAKCVIYPKGKTTWEGFIPPCQFKDGDVLISVHGKPFILKKIHNNKICESYCGIRQNGEFVVESHNWTSNYNLRLATEEEKEKLFKAIKDNGYKWNSETKTLEELVESRFNEGDWITDGVNKCQILFIDDIQYWYSENCILGSIESVDKRYHLWTINDAKDGDILAFDDNTIVIFKDLYNKTTFHSYCHIEDGVFSVSKLDCPDWWGGEFKPATKEQRDFLFQKIKEAGYKWNEETKTLEKLMKFKDGDIITCSNGACTFTSIFKDKPTDTSFQQYCSVILDNNKFIGGILYYVDYANPRFATEEEKQKLFDAIKENGYKWNEETKTLDKLVESHTPKKFYIRIGDIPSEEKSAVYKGDVVIGYEDGVSVYDCVETDGLYRIVMPFPLKEGQGMTYECLIQEITQCRYKIENPRNVYLVSGMEVGKGNDNEPLIKEVKILKDLTGQFNTKTDNTEETKTLDKLMKFKDGDIVFYNDTIAIFKEWGDETLFRAYVIKYLYNNHTIVRDAPLFGKSIRREIRFATEEEKQKLFQAIKDNGYKWNPKTKTLKKLPKFKVGDKIRHKNDNTIRTISYIYHDSYGLYDCHRILFEDQDEYELDPDAKPKFKVGDKIKYRSGEIVYRIVQITEDSYVLDNLCSIPISIEHMYNLVPNKFDITTLVPFESRVLMRSSNAREWTATLYSHYNNNKFYGCGMCCDQCIPYEGNEHLLGKTDDCDEYFKNW